MLLFPIFKNLISNIISYLHIVLMSKDQHCPGADTGFSEGGGVMATRGGGDRGRSPLSAKNYYLNTQNFQLQGGGDHPYHPPLVSATGCLNV